MKPDENLLEWTIGGKKMVINHPGKTYWPEENHTKLEVLDYYKKMAPLLLPYLKDRPTTVRFFPRGISGFSFYKRDFAGERFEGCHTRAYREISQHKTIEVLIIDQPIGILELAAIGGLELHPWSSVYPRYHFPDIAIFDLDVTAGTSFATVRAAALKLRAILAVKAIDSYPKTSGGSGMHVYVPIEPRYSFTKVKSWVKSIGDELAASHPDLFTGKRPKGRTHVANRVTVDYLQNVVTRSTIAPYSLRARPGAPVSAPLTWNEVEEGKVHPGDFTLLNMPARVAEIGDVFAPVLKRGQSIL